MDRKFLFIVVVALFLVPSLVNAQQINCIFQVTGENYDCQMSSVFIPDDENLTITIGGIHQGGRTNVNVTRVLVSFSSIPFVLRAFFTTFINLQVYSYTQSNFQTRIQPNAFANLPNLREITISNTWLNQTIANAFTGASNVHSINLASNQLTHVPSGLFNGLPSLAYVNLAGNQLSFVPDTLFRNIPHLVNVNLNNNQLTRLPNTLLQTTPMLTMFSAAFNQIYQVGTRFLNPVPNLTSLNLLGNDCVNQNWLNIGGVGGPTKDQINSILTPCFQNYTSPGQLREYDLRLRGHMTLYDMDGNLIGRL